VNFEAKTISIVRAVEPTKKHGLRIKEPKTVRGIRTITIGATLVGILREVRERQLRLVAGIADRSVDLSLVKLPEEALVFPSPGDITRIRNHPLSTTTSGTGSARSASQASGFTTSVALMRPCCLTPGFRFMLLRHGLVMIPRPCYASTSSGPRRQTRPRRRSSRTYPPASLTAERSRNKSCRTLVEMTLRPRFVLRCRRSQPIDFASEGGETSPVGRPDFKSGKGPPAGPWWVRLPLSSAIPPRALRRFADRRLAARDRMPSEAPVEECHNPIRRPPRRQSSCCCLGKSPLAQQGIRSRQAAAEGPIGLAGVARAAGR
jgi:hypothetical protein